MDLAPPQFILGVILTDSLHHRRPGDKDLRGFFDHQRIMARGHAHGAQPCNRPQRQTDHRHSGQVLHGQPPSEQTRTLHVTQYFCGAYRAATTGSIHQTNQGQAEIPRHRLNPQQLVLDTALG